ncbi:hypothetical protein [Streptomyces sp. NPDC056323]|uniref:hypothetical protein n=1 Tax=unclassified Streptomyces TaxID=2593676 RepID=UPI0035DA71F3
MNSITVYGALGAIAFLAVAVAASSGHMVNTFMWVRAVLLPVAAVLIHRWLPTVVRRSSGCLHAARHRRRLHHPRLRTARRFRTVALAEIAD